jgi:hypothetical protein
MDKDHVKNHRWFKNLKADSAAKEKRIRKHAQSIDLGDSTGKPNLSDMFSSANRLGLLNNSKKLPDLIKTAILTAREVIDQFDFPISPAITYLGVKNVKTAGTTDDVLSGTIVLMCKFATVGGLKQSFDVPVQVVSGKVLPPSVIKFNGRDIVLAQSSVNAMVQRASSYELIPVRKQFSAPLTRDERESATELRNEIGYQAREGIGPVSTIRRTYKKAYSGSIGEQAEQVYDAIVGLTDNMSEYGGADWSEVASFIGDKFPELAPEDLVNALDMYKTFSEKHEGFPTISDQEMTDYFGVDPRTFGATSDLDKDAESDLTDKITPNEPMADMDDAKKFQNEPLRAKRSYLEGDDEPLSKEDEDDLLARGLHAGNYDAAYKGGDAGDSYIECDDEGSDTEQFQAGYMIGFISSASDSWMNDEEYIDAWDAYGKRIQSLGLVADNPYEAEEGFVEQGEEEKEDSDIDLNHFAKKAQYYEGEHGTGQTDNDIVNGMARALFVSSWGSVWEELENEYDKDFIKEEAENLGIEIPYFPQAQLMEIAPPTEEAAYKKAQDLYNKIEQTNSVDLSSFIPPGEDEGFDRQTFGHYLMMEALGHGVGWSDDHEDHGLKLPYMDDVEIEELIPLQNALYEGSDHEEEEGHQASRVASMGTAIPGGYEKVKELMDKAQDDGKDTFPRSWIHVLRNYILEVVSTASQDAWATHLVNDGYVLNPYGSNNRGRDKTAQVEDEWQEVMDEAVDDAHIYDGTKTPMEAGDSVKFQGHDGSIRGTVVEVNKAENSAIVKARGYEYRVALEDIQPLNSTFKKMWSASCLRILPPGKKYAQIFNNMEKDPSIDNPWAATWEARDKDIHSGPKETKNKDVKPIVKGYGKKSVKRPFDKKAGPPDYDPNWKKELFGEDATPDEPKRQDTSKWGPERVDQLYNDLAEYAPDVYQQMVSRAFAFPPLFVLEDETNEWWGEKQNTDVLDSLEDEIEQIKSQGIK